MNDWPLESALGSVGISVSNRLFFGGELLKKPIQKERERLFDEEALLI